MLDPWSARYRLETASLAPFAGEPLSAGAGQPEPPAEPERGADHEAPEAGSPEQAAMPLAEAEEGVPFVSGAERELETEQAGEHAASQWREPARPDSEFAPEHPAEHPAGYGTGGSESGEAAPPLAAEPERGEPQPASPVFVAPGDREERGATDNAAVEPAAAARVDAEPPQPELLPAEFASPPEFLRPRKTSWW